MKKLILAWVMCCTGLAYGANITDVRFQNTGAAQAAVPVTFGQVFAVGDVKKSDVLVGTLDGAAVPLQSDVKATYADGSVRHAIISLIVPKLAAGATGTMQLATGGAAATGVATPADLLASGFTASASTTINGIKYTASADQLLKAGTKATWLAGAIANEWQVSAPLTTTDGVAHPHLTARFAIRYYSAVKKARVDVAIENDWAYEPGPQNFTYDAEILVGGKSVYTKAALTHLHHARWRKVFWWGDAPAVNIQANTKYLIASKAVPNYDQAPGVAESLLKSLSSRNVGAFEPMGLGLASGYMPTTGANDAIGLMPVWSAAHVLSQDVRALDSVLGTGNTAGSYSMHYRDRETDRPVSLLKFPYMTIDGRSTDTMNPVTGKYEAFPGIADGNPTPYTHDTAHQPSLAYYPYLVTGDYYYLEEMQFWAMYNTLKANPAYRQYSKGLLSSEQERGQAWGLRALADAAAFTPDTDTLKTDLTALFNSNIDWYTTEYATNPAANKLGAIINGYAVGYNNNTAMAPWQDDFFTSAVGHAVDLGFVNAKPLLNWKAKFPVGRMTAPGFCWIDAVAYNLNVRTTSDGAVFDTFAQAQQSTRGADFMKLACGGPEMAAVIGAQIGDMGGISSGTMGYPSNMQPALAYAVDAGAPDAKRAWDLFMSRTVKPDYSTGPQFAIVPRSYVAAYVPPFVDPEIWQTIGKEGDTVTVPAGTVVRYGANGFYVKLTESGQVIASNAFFGKDPAPNSVKVLQKLVATVPVTPPVATPAKPGKVTTPSNTKLKSLKGLTLMFFGPATLAQAKVFTGVAASTKGVLTVTDAALVPGTVYGVIVLDASGKVLDILFPITAQ